MESHWRTETSKAATDWRAAYTRDQRVRVLRNGRWYEGWVVQPSGPYLLVVLYFGCAPLACTEEEVSL